MRLRYIYSLKITFQYLFQKLNSQFHTLFQMTQEPSLLLYTSANPLFTSVQHTFNCDSSCCVEWTSLVFFDAACCRDVNFHTPTEGRECSSSCHATSLSVTMCNLQYDVNFIVSA